MFRIYKKKNYFNYTTFRRKFIQYILQKSCTYVFYVSGGKKIIFVT